MPARSRRRRRTRRAWSSSSRPADTERSIRQNEDRSVTVPRPRTVPSGCRSFRQMTFPDRTSAAFDVAVIGAGIVVNATGRHGDIVDERLLGRHDFQIRPRKGQFVAHDNPAAALARRVLLPVPTATTEGVVVCRTACGTLFDGPTAGEQDSRDRADRGQSPSARSGTRTSRSRSRAAGPSSALRPARSRASGSSSAAKNPGLRRRGRRPRRGRRDGDRRRAVRGAWTRAIVASTETGTTRSRRAACVAEQC